MGHNTVSDDRCLYHNRAHCVDQAQHTTICDLSCVEGMTISLY
jgi:hypothetical protein